MPRNIIFVLMCQLHKFLDLNFYEVTNQVVSKAKSFHLYSGEVWFECWSRHRIFLLTVIVVFLSQWERLPEVEPEQGFSLSCPSQRGCSYWVRSQSHASHPASIPKPPSVCDRSDVCLSVQHIFVDRLQSVRHLMILHIKAQRCPPRNSIGPE
jgi:hypothetical protein